MDPVTHALVGSAAARLSAGRRLGAAAWLPGAVGGLLPDLDALIRSDADPLLYAEFHRHFTHALAFIPVGAAIAAMPWLTSRRARGRRGSFYVAALCGYATHGALDASTTYGTVLFWPFSSARMAWNLISIVDPVFTLILMAGVGAALWTRHAAPMACALVACLAYLATGAAQRDRALAVQRDVAAERGHPVERGAVFPGFGTHLVWRSVYRSGDTLYADRIRVPWSGMPTFSTGYRMREVREADLPPEVRADARQLRDFDRFRRFAGGWVGRAPAEDDLIGDARYSSSTHRFEPVWGIQFNAATTDPPVAWIDRSAARRIDPGALWAELRGTDPSFRPLDGGR